MRKFVKILDRDGFVNTAFWYFPEDFSATFAFELKTAHLPVFR